MTSERPRRKPQVIPLDDPDLVVAPEGLSVGGRRPGAPLEEASAGSDGEASLPPRLASKPSAARGIRWGAILVSALSLLGGIALTLSLTRFVSAAFERQDWIGWVSFALLAIATLAFVAMLTREVTGLFRLRRLGRVRRELEMALAARDTSAERRAIEEILSRFAGRPELTWQLAAVSEHAKSVSDGGDLARLVDRDVMPALDGDARRLVAATARRVSVVTALSPMALVTVGWILLENLRLLRALATLYGGQPGFLGTTRLARLVLGHIIATGGVALTDDLLGQFLGQDLVRRLSRRLGESLFNAALTARVGAAAIEVIRPLPYLEAPRVRARDFVAEIARWSRGSQTTKPQASGAEP